MKKNLWAPYSEVRLNKLVRGLSWRRLQHPTGLESSRTNVWLSRSGPKSEIGRSWRLKGTRRVPRGTAMILMKNNHYSNCQQKEKGTHHFRSKLVGSLPMQTRWWSWGLIQGRSGWPVFPTVYITIYLQGPCDRLHMRADGTTGTEAGAVWPAEQVEQGGWGLLEPPTIA